MLNRTAVPVLAVLLTCSSTAIGQGIPSIPGGTSLMKGLPNLSSISPGNAAGVLSYCMKNKVLSGGSPTNALSGLMKKPGVASSSGYATGQAGNIVTGQGQILPEPGSQPNEIAGMQRRPETGAEAALGSWPRRHTSGSNQLEALAANGRNRPDLAFGVVSIRGVDRAPM